MSEKTLKKIRKVNPPVKPPIDPMTPKERTEKAQEEISQILAKYGVVITLSQPQILIVPQEDNK